MSAETRIVTDILVSGYVHQIMDELKLSIPNEIIGLVFSFWFIDVCDTWSKSFSCSLFDIDDDEILKVNKSKDHNYGAVWLLSAFGNQSVEKGTFEWKIKFINRIQWICIGIINDDKESIEKDVTNNNYGMSYKRGGCFLLNVNGTFYRFNTSSYCPVFHDKDTIVTMILDMDKRTLSYKINDKDYGVAWDAVKYKKYRLVVTLRDNGDEIEFL